MDDCRGGRHRPDRLRLVPLGRRRDRGVADDVDRVRTRHASRALRPVRRHGRATQEPRRLGAGGRATRRTAAARRRRRRRLGRRRGHARPASVDAASSGSSPDGDLAGAVRAAPVFAYPSVLRGLRVAGARGDGAGHAGRHESGDVDRGGRRRCSRARRPDSTSTTSPAASPRRSAIATGCTSPAAPVPRELTWEAATAATRRRVRRGSPSDSPSVRRQPAVVHAGRGRRVRGVPRPSARSVWPSSTADVARRRCAAARRSPPPTPSWPTLLPMRSPASPGRTSRRRGSLAEHTWLARQTRGVDLVHHGGGTRPSIGPPADRADHPRPAVPRAPAVLLAAPSCATCGADAAVGHAVRRWWRRPASTCAAP